MPSKGSDPKKIAFFGQFHVYNNLAKKNGSFSFIFISKCHSNARPQNGCKWPENDPSPPWLFFFRAKSSDFAIFWPISPYFFSDEMNALFKIPKSGTAIARQKGWFPFLSEKCIHFIREKTPFFPLSHGQFADSPSWVGLRILCRFFHPPRANRTHKSPKMPFFRFRSRARTGQTRTSILYFNSIHQINHNNYLYGWIIAIEV